MKTALLRFLCLSALAAGASAQTPASDYRVTYTLVDGSYFVDDCLVCGRPTIMEPLRGTFELVLRQNTPPYTRYSVENVRFFTSAPTWRDRAITGDGVYTRFEEFARLQNLELRLDVKDSFTNVVAWFTNTTPAATAPEPLIEAGQYQTNGTLLQTFSMHLVAAPLREVWFSTDRPLMSTNRNAPTNQISTGDLLSQSGRVVKRNRDFVGRLGIMPIVPDLGLDALHVTGRGELLFSLPQDIFSETLGPLHHGDLLSNLGRVVKRNQDLLAAFRPGTASDAGLDAVFVRETGEILFSTRSNVPTATVLLSRGDILSDRGVVFMSQKELLANYHPVSAGGDYGLDAVHLLPHGEVWFSLEEGFVDTQLGAIQPGDLLSSRGRRVFTNRQLLAGFAPSDPEKDYGLDALHVILDTRWPKAPPWLARRTPRAGLARFEWDGEGETFQIEHALDPAGPWTPCSPIVPDLYWESQVDPGQDRGFYRLRQW